MNAAKKQKRLKPYEAVGSGGITSFVWKRCDKQGRCRYGFNLFRQHTRSGTVTQLYRASDLLNVVKVCHLLAVTLTQDGCLEPQLRKELAGLATALQAVTSPEVRP